jgi:hypothetical protein
MSCQRVAIRICSLVFLFVCFGCAQREHVDFVQLGQQCETVKVRPDWYSAEAVTACKNSKGEVTSMSSSHTDISMLAVIGVLLTATLALL